MKKILSILLAVLIVFTGTCFVFADELNVNGEGCSFSDVPQNYWAAEAIYGLNSQGIVTGLSDGTFLPEKKLQRGEFSKMLAAVSEYALKSPQNSTFDDVIQENSLYKYIETMSYCFIPFSNRTGEKPLFKPNNYMKREDAAYALVKLYNLDKNDDGDELDVDTGILNDMFKDSKVISGNMKRYVTIAVEDNLMAGINGNFNPQGVLTKADACVLIYDAMNLFSIDSGSETLVVDPKFVDPLVVGDVVKLKAVMTGKNGRRDVSGEALWDSSSPNVMSVSSDGKITALSIGEARITVQDGGQEADITIKVNVSAPKYVKIIPEKVNIKTAENYQLRATIAYPDGTVIDGTNSSSKLIWKSSDEKVALVDSKGRIRGIAEGKTEVLVYFNNFPSVKGTCEVTVSDEEIKENNSTVSSYDNKVGSVESTIDASGRIVDKIDYPFVDDPQIIGEWKSVDFVKEINDFTPDRKSFTGDLFLDQIVFNKGGETFEPWWTWTNGLILHSGDHTASKYVIKEIDGEAYMFMEWKSGDYTIRHMKPYYYVLKKVNLKKKV